MDAILINVVETAVLAQMQAGASFTALDISNALKAKRYPFRHREVAETLRDLYTDGALIAYGYDRALISVTTDAGHAQAYLYHHVSANLNDYTARDQSALPCVPADKARDLLDSVAADPMPMLARPLLYRRQAACSPRPSRMPRGSRRDGALPIPQNIIEQLGWSEGDALALKAEPGRITVAADNTHADGTVRVWGGRRVRICKTKLTLGFLSADVVTMDIAGDCLHIEAKMPANS